MTGLCSVATIYFMEIAPRHLRGALGGLYELGFASSMLLSTALGLPQILGNEHYWPILLSKQTNFTDSWIKMFVHQQMCIASENLLKKSWQTLFCKFAAEIAGSNHIYVIKI